MSIINLGNVVGLIRSTQPPSKTYVIWAKIIDPSFPEIVQLHEFNGASQTWVPRVEGGSLEPVLSVLTTPPSNPNIGDAYLVDVGGTGSWSTRDNYRAEWNGNQWIFIPPKEGMICNSTDEFGKFRIYESGSWVQYSNSTFKFDPVQDITALRDLDTTDVNNWPDKGTIYVEDVNAIYQLDRQSTLPDDGNLIIAPDTGVGRWRKVGAAEFDHNNLLGIQGGVSGEYFHLNSQEYQIMQGIGSSGNNTLFGKGNTGGYVAYSISDFTYSINPTTPNGLSINGQNQISLALSSSSQTGALSSTDWNTFNSKADSSHNHDASHVVSGQFDELRISQQSVVQHEQVINHNNLYNYDPLEHAKINDNDIAIDGLWSSNKVNNMFTSLVNNIYRRPSVIGIAQITAAPPSNNAGDRYILEGTGTVDSGWGGNVSTNQIVEFNGAEWIGSSPIEGWVTYSKTDDKDVLFNGVSWELRSVSVTNHGDLNNLGADDHTQYHTDSRALSWLGTRSTSDLQEGTRLYFSGSRVRSSLLDGFTVGSGQISASDSVLDAFGKLQGQVNSVPSGSGTENNIVRWGTGGVGLVDSVVSIDQFGSINTAGNLTGANYYFANNSNAVITTISSELRFNYAGQNSISLSGSATTINDSSATRDFVVKSDSYDAIKVTGNGNAVDLTVSPSVGLITLSGRTQGLSTISALQFNAGYSAPLSDSNLHGHVHINGSISSKSQLFFEAGTSAPTSLQDGMMWYDGIALNYRSGGATINLLSSGGGAYNANYIYFDEDSNIETPQKGFPSLPFSDWEDVKPILTNNDKVVFKKLTQLDGEELTPTAGTYVFEAFDEKSVIECLGSTPMFNASNWDIDDTGVVKVVGGGVLDVTNIPMVPVFHFDHIGQNISAVLDINFSKIIGGKSILAYFENCSGKVDLGDYHVDAISSSTPLIVSASVDQDSDTKELIFSGDIKITSDAMTYQAIQIDDSGDYFVELKDYTVVRTKNTPSTCSELLRAYGHFHLNNVSLSDVDNTSSAELSVYANYDGELKIKVSGVNIFDKGIENDHTNGTIAYEGYGILIAGGEVVYDGRVSPVSGYNFENDIVVSLSGGKTVGKFSNGQTIPSTGLTPEEVWNLVAIEYISPSFSSFTMSGQATTVEVGTTLSGSKTFTWGATQSGNISPNSIIIRDQTNDTDLGTGLANDGSEILAIGSIQKNIQASNQWRISMQDTQSATHTRNFTVNWAYYQFYGSSASIPVNSAQVRGLDSSRFNTSSNTFILNTGSVEVNFILCVPASKTISQVIDLDALNANITSQYILTNTFDVLDAGGNNVSYKVYAMTQAVPYSSNHRHQITLS